MLEIKGYELIEKIAEGGMAAVWKARQLSLDRIVAIKILDKESIPDASALDRFKKEAQTAARLNHPNIVQVFDAGEVEGHAYLVMEYVAGRSVGEVIALHGTVKEARALEILQKTAEALSYAWDKECLIHCDVNPNNILIEHETDHVKVTDLGISRMIGLRRRPNEDTDLIVGTPNYTSPEQSAGINDLDCRTDMYSLGATLYHMITGVLPFHDAKGSGAMSRHEEDFLEDPMVVNPELSPQVAWLVEKLMIKNRSLRPLYWSQTLEDIAEVASGNLPKPPLPEEGASTVRRSARRLNAARGKKVVIPPSKKKAPVKLAMKKPPTREKPVLPVDDRAPVAEAFRNTFILLFLAAAVYAGFYFYGKIKGPPVAVVLPEPEEISTAEETDAPLAQPDASRDWQNEDFKAGARLFNQALADYNTYQQDRKNPEVLELVEKNCREAITYFEASKASAPDSIDIDQYISQSYGLIANVRYSTMLATAEESMDEDAEKTEETADTVSDNQQQPPRQRIIRNVTFVDENKTDLPEPEPDNLLNVSLNPGWETERMPGGTFGRELGRLLVRHTAPTTRTDVDPEVILYPGVTCMMKAEDAADVLETALSIRRPLETPGFMPDSLYYYAIEGDFYGARELKLICDRNDRVVMIQLYDDRTVPLRMNESLFSSNWTVYNFVAGKTRGDADGLIAHQVRRRNRTIRIDTELAAAAAAGQEPTAQARVVLIMPERFAGMLLQINQPAQ